MQLNLKPRLLAGILGLCTFGIIAMYLGLKELAYGALLIISNSCQKSRLIKVHGLPPIKDHSFL